MSAPPDIPSLDGAGGAQLLTAAFQLDQARRQEDMAHAQALLRGALEELELGRGQEERRLAAAAAALRREYEARMQALERRFLAEAEALQNQLREGTEREVQCSQAAIDAKARELLAVLGDGRVSGGGLNWTALKPASGGVQALPAPSPPTAQPRREAAPASKAPPSPAVAAASEAIAALRLALPAAVCSAGSPAPAACRPATAAAASPARTAKALDATPLGTIKSSSPSLQLPVPPAGLPNTAAAMRASLLRSPPKGALAPGQLHPPQAGRRRSVSFAAGARGTKGGTSPARHATRPPLAAAAPAAAAAAMEATASPPHPHLQHASSSEFDDDSYLSEESSGDMDLASSRPPLVKTVNPGTPRSMSFASPRGSPSAMPAGSGSRAIHLNLTSSNPPPGSPSLRAYSPCTCRDGAGAVGGVPLAAGAAMPRVLSSSRLRATYSSD
ncbi:hypothetical protein ABPG75_006976 [Micractinium tetrahymenae]